jgi:hypothetical protein
MKKIYLLFVVVVLAACKSNSGTSNQATNHSQKVIKKFKPILQGIWVIRGYIDSLSKSKSPYRSKDQEGYITSMAINLENVNSDSTQIGYSLHNHEGSSFALFFKKGQLPTSLKISLRDYEIQSNFYELGYRVSNEDTSLILYHYNKNKKLIKAVRYKRVADKASDGDDMGWGIQYITNKNIITGKYKVTDSINNNSQVEFNNKGKVVGFLNFKKYAINTDFNAGPENNLDEIFFDDGTNSFTFKINSDTLNLYNTYPNTDSTKLIRGKLAYKLVRIK